VAKLSPVFEMDNIRRKTDRGDKSRIPIPKMATIDFFIIPPMPRTAKRLWKKYPLTHEFENNDNRLSQLKAYVTTI